jgi:hypothetical protein
MAALKRAALVAAVVALLLWWLWPRGQPAPAARAPAGNADSATRDGGRAAQQVRAVDATPRIAKREAGAGQRDAGADADADADPAMFGGIIELHNSFDVAKALSDNAAAAEARVDELCEKSRRLRQRSAPSGGADAAEFMAPRTDYEKPLDQPPGALHLPDEVRDRIRSYGDAWLQRITDADLQELDFSWLPQLARFDRWTVLTAGRLRDYKPDNVFWFPIPNYSSLMAWSKLRYALALRRGDMPAASDEVRHLAQLIRSQQLLIAELVAINLEKLDPQADVADLALRRQVEVASVYFGYPEVSPATVRKAIACAPAPCSALIDAAAANRSLAQYASTDNLALLRQLAADDGCESPLFDRISGGRELPAGEAVESAADGLSGAIAKWLDERSEAPGTAPTPQRTP